jgi:hypothetical protein
LRSLQRFSQSANQLSTLRKARRWIEDRREHHKNSFARGESLSQRVGIVQIRNEKFATSRLSSAGLLRVANDAAHTLSSRKQCLRYCAPHLPRDSCNSEHCYLLSGADDHFLSIAGASASDAFACLKLQPVACGIVRNTKFEQMFGFVTGPSDCGKIVR